MILKLPKRYLWLTGICIVLLVVNMGVIFLFDIQTSRKMRIFSTSLLFIFFVYYKGYLQHFLCAAFLCFVVRDILILDYENSIHKTFSFFLTIFGYLLISFSEFKKINFSGSTPVIIVFALILIGLNAFNVFYLSDVIQEGLDNNLQFILFFIQGAILILLGFVGFMYTDRYEGNAPLNFLYFVLCFILTDLCGLASYFFEVDIAYYPERIFYMLALVLMVNFTLTRNIQKENNYIEKEKALLS